MSFKIAGSLNPHGGPLLRRETIANSVTISENDSVKRASGFVALGTTGAAVFGHVSGISTHRGVGLNTDGSAGSDIGSFAGTFTTASDNQTVDQVKAEVDISKFTLYSATADDTLGTTTGSDLTGYNMDLADEDELDESTAATTAAQYHSHGLDPEDSSRVIVNIYESEVFGS